MIIRKKGQSILEYVILLMIVIGVFVAMSNYVKRGLAGRWKVAVDDIGEQYDPRLTNSFVFHIIVSNTETILTTVNNSTGGFWTLRSDATNTIETKSGTVTVGTF